MSCVGVFVKRDWLDAVGRHHQDAVEVRSLGQPLQPALELQPVDEKDPGLR